MFSWQSADSAIQFDTELKYPDNFNNLKLNWSTSFHTKKMDGMKRTQT